jgi:hypothetical protein
VDAGVRAREALVALVTASDAEKASTAVHRARPHRPETVPRAGQILAVVPIPGVRPKRVNAS